MRDFSRAISERRAAIVRIQEELAVLERAQALLNGSRPKIPDTESQEALSPRERLKITRRGARQGRFHPGGGVSQARAALKEAGMPLRMDELYARTKKRGYAGQLGSLRSTLGKMWKAGRIFVRTAPNTFGLLEWSRQGQPTSGGRVGTVKQAMIQALREQGQPLTATQVWDMIRTRPGVSINSEHPRDVVASMLRSSIQRRQNVFVKDGKKYGLVEWQGNKGG